MVKVSLTDCGGALNMGEIQLDFMEEDDWELRPLLAPPEPGCPVDLFPM